MMNLFSSSISTGTPAGQTEGKSQPNVQASDVAQGMEVYDLEGQWVGTVSEIWARVPSHGYLPCSLTHLNDYGPISGTSTWFDTAAGYIEVIKPVAPRLCRRVYVDLEHCFQTQGDYVLVGNATKSDRPMDCANRFHGLRG